MPTSDEETSPKPRAASMDGGVPLETSTEGIQYIPVATDTTTAAATLPDDADVMCVDDSEQHAVDATADWSCGICISRDPPPSLDHHRHGDNKLELSCCTRLQCTHVFHTMCLQQWLEECRKHHWDERCPLCRGDVPNDYRTWITSLDRKRSAAISIDRTEVTLYEVMNENTETMTWKTIACPLGRMGRIIRRFIGPNTAVVFKRFSALRSTTYYTSMTNTSDVDERHSTEFDAHMAIYTLDTRITSRGFARVRNRVQAAADTIPVVMFVEDDAIVPAITFINYIERRRQEDPRPALLI